MRHEYPILLDVSTRKCVIVGGGEVAARKAIGLLECGAKRVVVVSPELKAAFPTDVEHIADRYRPAYLADAGLVFAATDSSAVNDAVVQNASASGLLVSRADVDDDHAGDFVVPAKLRKGSVTLAISSGSAALAVLIRDTLLDRWDERWTKMADIMRTLRPELREGERDPAARRALFRKLASEEALDVLDQGGIDALRTWMKQ